MLFIYNNVPFWAIGVDKSNYFLLLYKGGSKTLRVINILGFIFSIFFSVGLIKLTLFLKT